MSLYGKTCKLFPHKQNLIVVVVVEFQPTFQGCLAIMGDHVHASKRYLIVLGIAILLLKDQVILPGSSLSHSSESSECVYTLCPMVMHQSIPAVPNPPPPPRAIVGSFSHTVHPGGRALAFHPITPGHLTISLFLPYNIFASCNDQLIGKFSKFLLEYI